MAALLGTQVVDRFVSGPAHGPNVSVPLIYDEVDPLPVAPGGLLLHTGRAERVISRGILHEFAAAGYSGIVLKARGEDSISFPEPPPIHILFIHEDVSWRQFFLLASAITQRNVSDLGQEFGAQGLFDIANSVALLLGGAVAIEDRDRNILAYSTVSGQQVDELRRDGILARRVPDLPKHDQQYRELYATAGFVNFAFDPTDGESPRTAIAVRAGSEILGSIWAITESAALTPGAGEILRDAATATAVQLLRHRSTQDIESHLLEEWLRSVLLGAPTEHEASHQFSASAAAGSALLAIRVKNDGTGAALYPSEVKSASLSTARLHGFDAGAALIGNFCFLLVANIPSEEAGLRAAENIAASLTKRFDLQLQISVATVCIGETDWVSLRDDLVDALGLPQLGSESRSIVRLADVRSELLLLNVTRQMQNLTRLMSPELERVRRSDATKDTDYEATLFQYLTSFGDISHAAECLHVHPNTLRYRLKKMTDLFGIDLSTPTNILALWLQLWPATTIES